jgi:two-component system phosphate regulon response regulator PhoB
MSTILLAEDDPDIRHLVSFTLVRAGFEVVAVVDGSAALHEARRQPPGLIILDVLMPRLSGIDVCRALRSDRHTAAVPVIMLTARARPQDLAHAYAAGATAYVVKPFLPRDLLTQVETVLARVGT